MTINRECEAITIKHSPFPISAAAGGKGFIFTPEFMTNYPLFSFTSQSLKNYQYYGPRLLYYLYSCGIRYLKYAPNGLWEFLRPLHYSPKKALSQPSFHLICHSLCHVVFRRWWLCLLCNARCHFMMHFSTCFSIIGVVDLNPIYRLFSVALWMSWRHHRIHGASFGTLGSSGALSPHQQRSRKDKVSGLLRHCWFPVFDMHTNHKLHGSLQQTRQCLESLKRRRYRNRGPNT